MNQTYQIAQQAQSLLNEAKQLVALPMSYMDQIEGYVNQYYALLSEGQGLTYRVQGMVQQYEQLYETVAHGQGNMLQRSQAILRQMKQAGRVSMEAQAIYDRLLGQQAATKQLVAASQGAVGQLQAAQATNQLLAVMTDQQASVQQLLATTGRVQVSATLRDAVADEQARANADRWLEGWPQGGFQGPGQGTGVRLPR